MKKILLFILILISINTVAFAYEGNPVLNEDEIKDAMEWGTKQQINELDTEELNNFIKNLKNHDNPLVKEVDVKEFLKDLISGKIDADIRSIISEIFYILFNEIVNSLGLMSQVIVLSILCGILKNMHDSFTNPSVGEMAYYACYIMVILLIINSLNMILNVGQTGIDLMVSFMKILIPILLMLLVAVGGVASSAIMQPTIALLVGGVSIILRNVMLPLIFLSAILSLINNMSDKIQLKRLGKLINNICGWILGIVFTVFIGIMAVQGVMAASFDGISIRTAKFAIDTFIPIVGGMFSQTVDTIIGCSLLVKNAVGIGGLILIAVISLAPAIKILALLFIYKLTSAILEPVTDSKIVDCLNSIGNILTLLLITVVGIAIMFFITVTLIIGAGNISVILR